MGKGQRSREARAGKREEMKKVAAKQRLMQKVKRIISVCVIVVLLLGVASIAVYNTVSKTGYFLRNTVAMSTDNYEVDNAMMTYYLKNQYYSFVNSYSDYLSMYGLDTSKSLKAQTYGEGTWFDYFLEQAKSQVNDVLLLAEKAKAEGFKLEDADYTTIDDAINSFKTYAETNKVSLDDYLNSMFGQGINESDIRRAIELTTLSSKYYNDFVDKSDFSDKALQTFFDNNKGNYIKADYLSYSFTASIATDATEEQSTAAKNDAKAKAEALAASNSVEEFKTALEKILTDKYTAEQAEKTEDEATEGEDDLTPEEQIKSNVESGMESAEGTNYYSEDKEDKLAVWMFNKDRQVGDTFVSEPAADATTFTYTAYVLTKTQYFDDYETVNARHILFSTEENEDAETALEKAKEVLKKYNESDTKNEEYFEKLAKEHSNDANVSTNGGLYEGVTKDANYPEEFYTWCYDSNRKEGDVDIVETDSGAHIMYFCGKGEVKWKIDAKEDKKNADYEEHLTELGKSYTVKANDGKMKKIDA